MTPSLAASAILAQMRTRLRPTKRQRPRAASASAVALLGAAALWLNPWTSSEPVPTAVARRQPFVQTLTESGTVGAARTRIYTAPVGSGQSKILALAPEGASVRAGDVLVQFDASAIELALQKEEALVQQARAELLLANEQLRLERLAATADLDDARRDVEAKQRQADNERDGRGRLAIEEARAAETEARREAERARTAHDDIASLLTEGFATRAEVQRAEQALRRAEEGLTIASLKLELLARFERPATLAQAGAALRAAQRGVAAAAERGGARQAQQQAAVRMAASAVEAGEARIAALRDRLAQSIIRAAGSGIVVHRELFFGNDRRKPQVGDEVFPNQPLVSLPENDSFIVETRVREVDLHRVTASQRVLVSIDAYSGLSLPGAVTLVGAVAQEDPERAGTKFFPVTIKLLDSDTRLRVGMTARVDIEVAVLPDAVIVPLDAVVEEDGRSYCVVVDGSRRTRQPIRVLARNDRDAAVSGLDAGRSVLRDSPVDAVGPGAR